MPKLLLLLTFLLTATACRESQPLTVARLPLQADSGSLAIRCGVLIDGMADEPMHDQLVVIRDGRIANVLPGHAKIQASTPLLDLSDYTCLPGLIDTHTHIGMLPEDSDDYRIYLQRTPDDTRELAKHNAYITLLAGFTAIRNVGDYLAWVGRDIRDRIDSGDIAGPRIQIGGFFLTIPHGGGDMYIPGVDDSDVPNYYRRGVARGAHEFRKKAEEVVAGGADLIKVIASGAVFGFGGIPGEPEMTPEELAAVVEVGHGAGLKVTAHAHGAQSIKDSILAGVDTIEHASLADDAAIVLAAEHRVPFSMDVYNGSYTAEIGPQRGWPEEFLRKNDETTEAQRVVFEKAIKAGVPILYGTDAGVSPHGWNARQFAIMVQRGMAAMDAIKAATSVAAYHLDWDDDVGAIEAGRFGDLIAVRGDPLVDIAVLQDVDVVIKGGLIFKLPDAR